MGLCVNQGLYYKILYNQTLYIFQCMIQSSEMSYEAGSSDPCGSVLWVLGQFVFLDISEMVNIRSFLTSLTFI